MLRVGDGIKSALRSMLHPPKDGYGVIRYYGSYCYRGLIDRKALEKAGYEAPDLPRMCKLPLSSPMPKTDRLIIRSRITTAHVRDILIELGVMLSQ